VPNESHVTKTLLLDTFFPSIDGVFLALYY